MSEGTLGNGHPCLMAEKHSTRSQDFSATLVKATSNNKLKFAPVIARNFIKMWRHGAMPVMGVTAYSKITAFSRRLQCVAGSRTLVLWLRAMYPNLLGYTGVTLTEQSVLYTIHQSLQKPPVSFVLELGVAHQGMQTVCMAGKQNIKSLFI
jgi:hypothetical protein